ncbi:MAG TPA: NUDIX hydrolase [Cyanobacteria bacterium UBA11162]|nr:NUDIX hydrolase [Cyanobacteria bacterium UBA11162]
MNKTPASYIEQSGVIPYRLHKEEIQVLLITSMKNKRWIIPKGIIEPAMTPQDSAAKEAWEEAGILGQVLPNLIGTYEYHKWGSICRVQVFLLHVENIISDWPEANYRKRKWWTISQAAKQVREPEVKQMLLALPNLLLTSISHNQFLP